MRTISPLLLLLGCAPGTGKTSDGEPLGDADADADADQETDGDADSDADDCGEDCDRQSLGGEDGEAWDVENEGNGVVVEDGALTLGATEELRPYIWIPSGGDATVTKVNTRTWVEEGRYRLGPGNFANLGGISTSLAVDVVVSASVPEPRVTRVNVEDCAAGDTSSGRDDVRDWGDDACVMWSTVIPTPMSYSLTTIAWEARRSLDALEHFIWVGDAIGHEVIELDGDGNLTGREVDVSIETAGIAMDPDGMLWVGAHGIIGILTEVDPVEAEVVDTYRAVGQKYDCIAADAEGRIWITGLETTAAVFDQTTEEFTDLGIGVWGIAVDGEGSAWFGGLDALLYEVDRDDLSYRTWGIGFGEWGYGTVYTGVDVDGKVWSVDPSSVEAHVSPPGDPENFDIAIDTLLTPGACGDMTGTQLAYVVDPVGTYAHVFEGCPDGAATIWDTFAFDAFVPGESRIRFEVRTGETLADLAASGWVAIGVAPDDDSPLDVASALAGALVDPGHLLELRVTLLAGDDDQRPILREVSITRTCEDAPS